MEPKKPLKKLVTLASQEVFDRLSAEPNYSALIEALLAQYYGINITTDTPQGKVRNAVLETAVAPAEVPAQPAAPEVVPLDPVIAEPAAPEAVPAIMEPVAETPSAAPELPMAPVVEPTPVDLPTEPFAPIPPEALPQTEPTQPPADQMIESKPIGGVEYHTVGDQTPPEAATEVAPESPVTPVEAPDEYPLYAAGSRVCPTCGNQIDEELGMCINCL